ncbi:hypothetical protein [Phaeobacter inhibens]|uniref:hypothetical protein n=1 Tax=Phaeobacter inhibens TaxID=221822 RepID=UPI00248F7EB4|nr:hypothetical protein [Phaeobacter inhibens]
MKTQADLHKILIDAIVNGALVLQESERRIRFELFSASCSVSGPLIVRRDWADCLGRPGLMPVIDQVEFEGMKSTYSELYEDSQEYEEMAARLLHKRLAPGRLFMFDGDRGWLLSAFNTPTLNELDQSAA